jgi:hypothetical protein
MRTRASKHVIFLAAVNYLDISDNLRCNVTGCCED